MSRSDLPGTTLYHVSFSTNSTEDRLKRNGVFAPPVRAGERVVQHLHLGTDHRLPLGIAAVAGRRRLRLDHVDDGGDGHASVGHPRLCLDAPYALAFGSCAGSLAFLLRTRAAGGAVVAVTRRETDAPEAVTVAMATGAAPAESGRRWPRGPGRIGSSGACDRASFDEGTVPSKDVTRAGISPGRPAGRGVVTLGRGTSQSPGPLHPPLVPDRAVGLVDRAVGAVDQEPVEAAREPAVVGDREHGALERLQARPPAPPPTATSRLSVGSSSSSRVAPDSSSSRIWKRACWPPESDSKRCSAACASS